MPELPQSEANRRGGEAQCLNRTIAAVRLGTDTARLDLPGRADRDALVGRQVTEARHHGKGGTIPRKKVGGRTVFFCPKHQEGAP